MTTITIIGLGEAGRLYARGLTAAGATVRGYDPFVDASAVVDQSPTLADAVAPADVVLSLVWARTAIPVAEQAIPLLAPHAVFADLNTASPDVKRRIADVGVRHAVPVADVAVLAPVPRAEIRTPLLACGPGARPLAARLRPYGVPLETIAGEPGAAAQLKLLRSVFMKGLAALAIEALDAARAAGAEEWMRGQIASELGPDGDGALDRLVDGTYTHAVRREQEVRDALAALEIVGRPADMTRGTLAWFERITGDDGS